MSLLTKNIMKHMYAVAECMYDNYDKANCKILSKEEVYLLGLNHDIGHICGVNEHETRGALLFSKSPIGEFIGWHEYTPKQYLNITGKIQIPSELLLLWYADMMIEDIGDKAGKKVGFEKRLQNIKVTYGEKSMNYKKAKEIIEYLLLHGDKLNT